MILALTLLACGSDPVDGEPEPALPSPYIYEEGEPPAPTYTLEQIGAGLQIAVERAVTIDAKPVLAGYDVAMAGQEGACPNWYDDGEATWWYDQCTSATGTAFSGYGYTLVYDGLFDAESGYTFDGRALFAAATIETGDGLGFAGAGTAYDLRGHRSGDGYEETYDQVMVQGSFAWEGAEAADTWIEEGLSPDLYVIRYSASVYEGVYAYVDGGISPLPGDIVAVAFDAITILPAEMGSTCELEPAGAISVRGADGSWYDVLFDGPSEAQPLTPADLCDGCGQVYYQGEAMGEACADFSALLARR